MVSNSFVSMIRRGAPFEVALHELNFLSPATFNVSQGQIASEVLRDFPRSVQRRPIPVCHHFLHIIPILYYTNNAVKELCLG